MVTYFTKRNNKWSDHNEMTFTEALDLFRRDTNPNNYFHTIQAAKIVRNGVELARWEHTNLNAEWWRLARIEQLNGVNTW